MHFHPPERPSCSPGRGRQDWDVCREQFGTATPARAAALVKVCVFPGQLLTPWKGQTGILARALKERGSVWGIHGDLGDSHVPGLVTLLETGTTCRWLWKLPRAFCRDLNSERRSGAYRGLTTLLPRSQVRRMEGGNSAI